MRLTIAEAALATGVPAGTIRRWLSEERLVRHGDRKPYRVDYDEVLALRALLLREATPRPVVVRVPRDDICYESAHRRVYAIHGKAREHPCYYCGLRAVQWAYDHQDPDERVSPQGCFYSPKPEHYLPLCHSCHSYLDFRYAAIRRGVVELPGSER